MSIDAAKTESAPVLNDRRLQLWLWTAVFVIFLLSPVSEIEDSKFSLLVTESLLHHHTFDLSAYHIPGLIHSTVARKLDLLHTAKFY